MAKLSLNLFMFLICSGNAFKILLVFHFPSGSHNHLGDGFVRHLLKGGHEVTYITTRLMNHSHPNLYQVDVSDNIYALPHNSHNVKAFLKQELKFDQDNIFHMMLNITKSTLNNKNVLKLLHDPVQQFDVVISDHMFNEIHCGFAAVFDCPHIWFYPNDANFVPLSLIDEASNPAYTSNLVSSDVPPFTFLERVKSLSIQLGMSIRSELLHRRIEKETYESKFGPIMAKKGRKLPPFEVYKLNTSLILGNSHVSLGQAIRLPQNYKGIGGYHIDSELDPLPEGLQNLMDNATRGVIYFSMGSNLKGKDWPDVIKKDLLKLFGGLNQTVLWKLEEELPNIPKNVHIYKWLPQTSILAHQNCLLFITHGGLLSTTEAMHFGKPIIGIPVYFDQFNNVDRAVHKGFATKVKFGYNLASDLKVAVKNMLGDSRYAEKAKELSFIYHHRPAPPGAELVHWVEHVVKTRGALHLRSPALMLPWYQKMYLDLALLIIIVVVLILYCFKTVTSKYIVKSVVASVSRRLISDVFKKNC